MRLIELVNESSFCNFVGLPKIPARDGKKLPISLKSRFPYSQGLENRMKFELSVHKLKTQIGGFYEHLRR